MCCSSRSPSEDAEKQQLEQTIEEPNNTKSGHENDD